MCCHSVLFVFPWPMLCSTRSYWSIPSSSPTPSVSSVTKWHHCSFTEPHTWPWKPDLGRQRSPEGRYLPPELQRATSMVHSRGCRGPGNPSLHSCFLKAEDKGSAPSEPVYEVLRSLFPTHPLPVSVLFQVSILPLHTPPSPSVFQQSAPISSPLPC